jgi:hypothetical protein
VPNQFAPKAGGYAQLLPSPNGWFSPPAGGPWLINNHNIHARFDNILTLEYGIHGQASGTNGMLVMNSIFKSRQYGIWMSNTNETLELHNVHVHAYGPGDNYAVRGGYKFIRFSNSIFDNNQTTGLTGKSSYRVWFCFGGVVRDCEIRGGDMLIGGGGGTAQVNPYPYFNVTHSRVVFRSRWNGGHIIDMHSGTRNCRFELCDFILEPGTHATYVCAVWPRIPIPWDSGANNPQPPSKRVVFSKCRVKYVGQPFRPLSKALDFQGTGAQHPDIVVIP